MTQIISQIIVDQIVQIAGSLVVLVGFALAQFGVLDPKSQTYLLLNAIGAVVLAVAAAIGAQWGFLLLEVVWGIVSLAGLVRIRLSVAPDTE